MRLSVESAYGVFAVEQIARRGADKPLTAGELAELSGIPARGLATILDKLIRAQVLKHATGMPPSLTLARPAQKISLLQIVEAIEGPTTSDLKLPEDFGSQPSPPCDPSLAPSTPPASTGQSHSPGRTAPPPVREIQSIAAGVLATQTIADLLAAEDRSDARSSMAT